MDTQYYVALSGVLPAIVAMWIVDRLDAKRPEPPRTRRLVVFFGMLSVIPALVLEVVLSTMGPGEYFGEMALDRRPRSASIMTLVSSRFLIVPGDEFRGFLASHPAFALSLVEKLIYKVRALTESVKSLAFMDVYGRVARLLLELAEDRDGRVVIGERLTQQDIASRVGASREMVSRILKDLSVCGVITQSRAGIVLHRKPPARW